MNWIRRYKLVFRDPLTRFAFKLFAFSFALVVRGKA